MSEDRPPGHTQVGETAHSGAQPSPPICPLSGFHRIVHPCPADTSRGQGSSDELQTFQRRLLRKRRLIQSPLVSVSSELAAEGLQFLVAFGGGLGVGHLEAV